MGSLLSRQRHCDGRVVLITGCTEGGIGFALAREFNSRGALVFASARRLAAMAALREEGIETLEMDVTSEESMKAAVWQVVSRAGRIDLLINNAGVGLTYPVAELPMDGLRRLYETNLFGAIRLSQLVFPHMAARGEGLIVNVGSMAGYVHRPWNAAYASSKAALHAATDCMRMEMKPFGINLMLVAPGFVRTNIFRTVSSAIPPLDASSWYKPYEPAMGRLSSDGVNNTRVTSAQTFARKVADVALKSNPPYRLIYGYMSGVAWLLSWLPMRLQDCILWARSEKARGKI